VPVHSIDVDFSSLNLTRTVAPTLGIEIEPPPVPEKFDEPAYVHQGSSSVFKLS